MISLRINDMDFQVPQTWNELNLKQALGLYAIIMSDVEKGMPPGAVLPAKRIRMMCYLLGLDEQFMNDWRVIRQEEYQEDGDLIFYSEIDEICSNLDGFFDIEEDAGSNRLFSLKFSLTKCPFKKLTRTKKGDRKKHYYAPADELDNLTLYELGTTFTMFENYLETQEEAAADRLLATLFRPAKPPTEENRRSAYQGDRRLPLLHHEATIDKRACHMAKLPPLAKQLILFWFASCRQQIVENNPDIFTAPSPDKVGPDFGWGGVLLSLADGLTHLDQVSQQPYQNGLLYLRYLEHQRREQEKALRARK